MSEVDLDDVAILVGALSSLCDGMRRLEIMLGLPANIREIRGVATKRQAAEQDILKISERIGAKRAALAKLAQTTPLGESQ